MFSAEKIKTVEEAIANYVSQCEKENSQPNTSYLGWNRDLFRYYDINKPAEAYQSLLKSLGQTVFNKLVILYAILTTKSEPELSAVVRNALTKEQNLQQIQTDLQKEIETDLSNSGTKFNDLVENVIEPIQRNIKDGLFADDGKYDSVKTYLTDLSSVKKIAAAR